ncbi:hypothetical protein P171DRAFT_515856 [Karstenula rhodostoma CBS 690.94]|uniref:Secreted protein n=1 Tax=Karstenula rhodostoma CBS 690.94 TaxID=1392251 RepID=A0A9P4UK30_9PLEO|nr:hypothetical protein P171DRAFT_515856 [Karstenula rhodostoma CBS 690.94]
MRSIFLGLVCFLIGMALGHPGASDPNPAQASGSGGVYACTMPQWSHGCKYFPAHDGCQNADLFNNVGGRVFEIYALGPDYGTRCKVFAKTNCVEPFYPKHDTPTRDWSMGFPGTAETASAVRSFKCYRG